MLNNRKDEFDDCFDDEYLDEQLDEDERRNSLEAEQDERLSDYDREWSEEVGWDDNWGD